MKKILLYLFALIMVFSAVGCGEDAKTPDADTETAIQETKTEPEILGNENYRNVLINYYNAYAYCDAAYQMSTFAPPYKDYVIAQYGYGNEEEMTNQLQIIIEQSCVTHEMSYGADYELIHDVKSEKTFSAEETESLKTEMEGLYGGEFPITEAVEVTSNVVITGGENAGNSEETLTLGKFKDGSWYILK